MLCYILVRPEGRGGTLVTTPARDGDLPAANSGVKSPGGISMEGAWNRYGQLVAKAETFPASLRWALLFMGYTVGPDRASPIHGTCWRHSL